MTSAPNPFQRFHALGYTRLVPIIPPGVDISANSTLFKRMNTPQDGRGKTPGRRNQDGTWGSFDWVAYECDETDLDRWNGMGAGVGIKTGDMGDGTTLVLIDADTKDHAEIVRDRVLAILGPLPVRVGNYPKAGYVCRVRGPFQYQRIEFGQRDEKNRLLDRVEILSDGRQFVAEGIHPKTGKPYAWPQDVPHYADLPIFEPAQITGLLDDLRLILPAASEVIVEGATTEHTQASLKGSLDAVTRAVAALPNTHNTHPSRESYRDVGYAIKAALPDEPEAALELFHDWCARYTAPDGSGNDPDVVDADWRRMKGPFRRGASWLYDQAATLGTDYDRADAWFEEQPVDLFAISTGEEESAPKDPQKRLTLVPFDEAADGALTNSTLPLVKGLLDQCALSVMYGQSNVGKTFVAMDVAFHIAAGMAWGGLKVSRGAVVYVAAEGGSGARKRAEALRRRYPEHAKDIEFHLLLSSIDLLRPDADLVPLVQAIKALGLKVSLIVLDTLSRVMAGGEENGSVDMGTMIKHFDLIRKATGAHVMIVHHAGKNQAAGARGHSSLRAATDTEIEISEGQITVMKQRDLDKEYTSAFRLDVVTLGADGDGDPITSCTVALVPRIEAQRSPATPTEELVMDALRVVVSSAKEGAKGARLGEIVDMLEGQQHAMGAEAVRSHLKNMARKNLVESPARGYWAQKAVDLASTGSFYVDQSDIQALEATGRASGASVFE